MPEVSIIIPVYNNEAYVQKCIDSVKKQSFEDFEAIVVNDGSTDNSRSIIEALIENDERFHLINQENQGVAAARNRGLDLAKGKYLTFIDGDDYVSRDYIAHFYAFAEQGNYDMLICGLKYVTENGRVLQELRPNVYQRIEREEWTFRISAVCSHFYRRKLWETYQIRFQSGERGEDLPIALFFSAVCDKINVLSEPGYYYVQHSLSATHNFKGLKKFKLPYQALENTLKKIQKIGIVNSPEYHELFLLRILAYFYFNLGRGAAKQDLRELCDYIVHILEIYFPRYYSNPKTRLLSDVQVPFYQKIAVKIFVILVRTNLIYPICKLMHYL